MHVREQKQGLPIEWRPPFPEPLSPKGERQGFCPVCGRRLAHYLSDGPSDIDGILVLEQGYRRISNLYWQRFGSASNNFGRRGQALAKEAQTISEELGFTVTAARINSGPRLDDSKIQFVVCCGRGGRPCDTIVAIGRIRNENGDRHLEALNPEAPPLRWETEGEQDLIPLLKPDRSIPPARRSKHSIP